MNRIQYTFLVIIAVMLASGCGKEDLSERQAAVAERGMEVMPFDLERTTHIFEKLDSGGRQQVLSDDNDPHQIELIQAHLKEEAERFGQGDFHDPEMIHGAAMPGLHELMMGHDRIRIEYTPLDNGGQIDYSTEDSTMVIAIHQWFDAQVSDHGRHAQDHH